MEISSAHHQAMSNHQLEEMLGGCPRTQHQQDQLQELKVKPQPEQALRCPRCDSTNTKFCYYNNYSLSQPRYFCKGCRRYWTQGGSLRNVPVGGGCRKNKRSSSSKKALITTNSNPNPNPNPLPPTLPPPLPLFSYDPSDLTLAFANLHKQPTQSDPFLLGNPNPNATTYMPTAPTGLLDILRSGFLDSTTTTTTSGFHNMYYGYGGNGNVEEGESGTVGGEEMGLQPFEGSCKLAMDHGGENSVLMGLPWQLSGGDGSMGVDSATGREFWNNNGSWHGLINSSLM